MYFKIQELLEQTSPQSKSNKFVSKYINHMHILNKTFLHEIKNLHNINSTALHNDGEYIQSTSNRLVYMKIESEILKCNYIIYM